MLALLTLIGVFLRRSIVVMVVSSVALRLILMLGVARLFLITIIIVIARVQFGLIMSIIRRIQIQTVSVMVVRDVMAIESALELVAVLARLESVFSAIERLLEGIVIRTVGVVHDISIQVQFS